MTSYYDVVRLLLTTIQDKKPKNFEELVRNLSVENPIIASLITNFGKQDSIIFLSDVLKDMFDEELVMGFYKRFKTVTNHEVDRVFSIDRLTPKGLILNNSLKEKTFKERFISAAKEKGISTFGKIALDLMVKVI